MWATSSLRETIPAIDRVQVGIVKTRCGVTGSTPVVGTMNLMTTYCRAPGCTTRIISPAFLCERHAAQLPAALRSRIAEQVAAGKQVDTADIEAVARLWALGSYTSDNDHRA